MNRLQYEQSSYLLQHANNPVDWYPWCNEAFEKAKKEDKPIFLSIGYSTCHWCHVMAHESFENKDIADILNKNFISIKVDKEERPDIDSIYMKVCQAYTGGSGGWPTSLFITWEQKPFFAGTYFPPYSKFGMIGFKELLNAVIVKWSKDRDILIESGNEIIKLIEPEASNEKEISESIIDKAFLCFKNIFDSKNGGFGSAPKFPTPHNILFLLDYYKVYKDKEALYMAEKTLQQMYKGGIFDHIGGGFSRYSTDKYFLAPHFEKMLYDNALLIMAYTSAYKITGNRFYRNVAEKTTDFVLKELTNCEGGFFSAQDADSDGIEGKYYIFDYDEIIDVLGKEYGEAFNRHFNITKKGNFEGKNIPNLLNTTDISQNFETSLNTLYKYRRGRTSLHTDSKILTAWNALMICALADMGKVFKAEIYINAAERACSFIENNLMDNNTLYVSWKDGKSDKKGFLDDYAFTALAMIKVYEATLNEKYLKTAIKLAKKAMNSFFDYENGGFYLYGSDNEKLIIRPKETYDGAIPCGNSVMAYTLILLSRYAEDREIIEASEKQLKFMYSEAEEWPINYSFYLTSLFLYFHPKKTVVCVLKDTDDVEKIKKACSDSVIKIINGENNEYSLVNNKTTFYICGNFNCLPPTNDFEKVFQE